MRSTPATAGLVLVGGDVITQDPARPRAQAIAIGGERILAVGSDEEIQAFVGPTTRVIALAGRTVSPGLVDGHCHLYGLGAANEQVSLKGITSERAAAEAVAAAAKARRPGEWITGRGWDQNLWGGEFPTRASLDAALGDQPAALRRVDGHAVWVNSAALKLAEITRATPDPAGGKILRDARGEPTGVLVDRAIELVDAKVPGVPRDVRERRIRAAAQQAVELGFTGVHEMGIDDETAAVYRALASAGELPLRVAAYLEGSPAMAAELAARPRDLDRAGHFSIEGIKLFADGALGSRGAALAEDYSDAPGNRGLWVIPPAALAEAVEHATAAGWQVATHAIGDAATRATVDAYETARRTHPDADLRPRVEHAQVMMLEDIPRMARLGVIASMQPTHATSDMPWAEARLGPKRIRGAYAWRTMLTAGVHLAAGSDFPVEDPSPMKGLYAAVMRQDEKGEPSGGWYPDQRMTLDEALFAFTAAPAYATFVESERGRLIPGYVADVTVFDRRLTGDRSLLEAHATLTIVGGRVVYERREAR